MRGTRDSLTWKIKNVSWFLVLVSWIQKCLMFLEDIRYILPNSHFMLSDRYEIHIQDFWDFIKRIFIISRCPPFRNMSTLWVSNISTFAKLLFLTKCSRVFLVFVLGVLGSPEINIVGFGAWWRVQKCRNHGIWSFGRFKWWNRDCIVPNRSRLILGSF